MPDQPTNPTPPIPPRVQSARAVGCALLIVVVLILVAIPGYTSPERQRNAVVLLYVTAITAIVLLVGSEVARRRR